MSNFTHIFIYISNYMSNNIAYISNTVYTKKCKVIVKFFVKKVNERESF